MTSGGGGPRGRVGAVLALVALGAGCGSSTTSASSPLHKAASSASTSTSIGGKAAESTTTAAPTTTVAPSTTEVPATTAATAPPTTTTAALPTVTFGTYTGVRPTTVALSGDGSNVVNDITWQQWAQGGAQGYGTVGIESCVPDCASGSVTDERALLVLTGVVGGHFTHLAEDVTGRAEDDVTLPDPYDSAS